MSTNTPIRYYDNIELVRYHYDDMLLPSDVYHFVQDGIKTSNTVILPMNFFEYWDEGKDTWYFKPKEYITLHSTIHNEKGVRLFIAPMLNDENLMSFIRFPKGIDEYVDKDPRFYNTNWLVIDRKSNSWTVRKRIYMSLDDIPYLLKVKGNGKTFFFGILYLFPNIRYKIAFNDSEIDRALSAIPKEMCETMSNTEKCWSWLLNYLDDVRIIYLFGKGHDIAPYYSVTDWESYFIAGIVK